MDTFVKILDEKLSGPMTKLAEQKHLRAVRDGIIATLPIIIVGSFFLILASPPLPESWGITIFLKNHAGEILLPYRLSMAILTLYATFGIGASLANSYKLDEVSGGILASAAFLLTFIPVNVPADLNAGVAGWVLPMANLGGGGMFVGIITSILAVEIYRFTDRSNFKISMPPQVPTSVARSFEALVPTAILLVLMASITYWIGFDWHSVVSTIVKPIVRAADSLPSVLLIVFLISFFWAFGIHGASIVGTLARPIWLDLFDANTAAVAAGEAIPHIAAEPFYQWFIWIGGTGLGLAIVMLLFSKSTYSKSLGKTAFIPALFNINEPLIFGAPIVLNPLLIIPFMMSGLLNAVISWFATTAGLVNKVTVIAPWTLPGPIGAFIATKDWRAIVLNLLLIVLSVAIYYPFFKIYDKRLYDEEQGKLPHSN